MAEKKPLTKQEKRSGWVALIVITIIIAILVSTCGGDDKVEEAVDPVVAAKISTDSIAILNHLNENINLLEGMSFEFSEFSNRNCRLSVTIPEGEAKIGADVIGKGICILAVQWLAENEYEPGYDGIYTSCYVYSPYSGVTNKPGMVTRWGNAHYDTYTDAVVWEWDKSK